MVALIVEGKTLYIYDRVYSAKQKQLQEPGSISTGKRLWANIRALHGDASVAIADLDLGGSRPQAEIWDGMKAALLRHPPNRALLMEAVSGSSTFSLSDFKATAQVLLRLSNCKGLGSSQLLHSVFGRMARSDSEAGSDDAAGSKQKRNSKHCSFS
eukprot:6491773-Amphidinium_carterae.1